MAKGLRRSPRVLVSYATIAMIMAFHGSSARGAEALLGVQQGPGCTGTARVANFVKWFGREPDLMLDFLDNRSWRDITATGWWINCRAKAGRKVVWSVPMLPSDGTSTLVQGAGGAYDGYFRQIAAALIAGGFRDAIVRIGWEFNADWFTWAAAKDPQAWVEYWRRIVTAMRSVPGAKFRFDWCSNLGKRQINPELVYPGDAYVDIIGMDVYNASATEHEPAPRWNELMNMPNGLLWHSDFASRHNKPMSFPEWGTGTNASHTGGADDGYFIEQMATWIKQHRVAYHIYWDDTSGYNSKLSDGHQPAAGAAFIRLFSKGVGS